ncbi:hypothetical protein KC19_1G188600 [Ceratodon purpureus]|uniref:Uncharacterized protein n=1 Tax=Ceratodon purpureus TaxID=3225 RepID=A0A8T0J7I6_CERPU|nr:hypothetical protein KC19_1G188600 [Ceratodon purpureus]
MFVHKVTFRVASSIQKLVFDCSCLPGSDSSVKLHCLLRYFFFSYFGWHIPVKVTEVVANVSGYEAELLGRIITLAMLNIVGCCCFPTSPVTYLSSGMLASHTTGM